MKKTKDFTEGKILLPLLQFALPVFLAMFLQSMYGAVDLLIVGQFSEAADVSAVSTGSQILHSVTVVITGLAMGITVLIGQKIGEKKPEEAGQAIGAGVFLFGILSLILTILMVFGAKIVSAVMQAPIEAFEQTVAYVRICCAGTIFIVAYNVLGSIFRGIGDSQMPLIIRKRPLPFTFQLSDIRPRKSQIRRILTLGTPIALQDLLVSISFLVIMAIVNTMGVIASAGVGVAEKLCGFIMLLPSAFGQAMSAFVAQNIGARKWDRAKKVLWYGVSASFVAGVIMFYASFFHGDLLSGLFAKDVAVIAAAADYLKAYGIDCLLTAFLFCFIGYFNGCGHTFLVMVQGIVGAFLVRIPLAFLISSISGASLFMIGLATPASTVVQIMICMGYYLWQNKKQLKD